MLFKFNLLLIIKAEIPFVFFWMFLIGCSTPIEDEPQLAETNIKLMTTSAEKAIEFAENLFENNQVFDEHIFSSGFINYLKMLDCEATTTPGPN